VSSLQILPVLKSCPAFPPQTTIPHILLFSQHIPFSSLNSSNTYFPALLVSKYKLQNATPPNSPRALPQNTRTPLPDLRPRPTNHPPPSTRRLGTALKTATSTNLLHALPTIPFHLLFNLRHRLLKHNPLRHTQQSDLRRMSRVP